jgi:hypothetical protein
MWYYCFNNEPTGPVNEDAIRSLIDSNTIQPDTLVWREGMPIWRPVSATSLAALFADLSPLPPTLPQNAAEKRMSNKSLFIAWMATNAFYPLMLIASRLSGPLANWGVMEDFGVAFYTMLCLVFFLVLASMVLELILLYRYWSIIQDGHASTTPGRAVGFQFIPFYNYYWFFRAYWGLARDNNRYIQRHFSNRPELQVRRSSPGLALASLIFRFAGGLVVILTMLILVLTSFFSSVYSGDGAQVQSTSEIIAYTGLAYGLIDWVLMTLMLINLYRSGDSILKVESL